MNFDAFFNLQCMVFVYSRIFPSRAISTDLGLVYADLFEKEACCQLRNIEASQFHTCQISKSSHIFTFPLACSKLLHEIKAVFEATRFRVAFNRSGKNVKESKWF